jgi:rhodanese-related sulfurtransferase
LKDKGVSGAVDEISVEATWSQLASDPQSQLVDVRTAAEWNFVGVPDLNSLGKDVVFAEWQDYPGQRVHADFAERLSKALSERGIEKSANLFFICRSGARSLAAARAMTALGHTRCHNVTGGFEGQLDSDRHRGKRDGWKAAGLSWRQS